MTTLSGASDAEKLAQLATKTYKEQCIWFLNANWAQCGGEAEKIWAVRFIINCFSTTFFLINNLVLFNFFYLFYFSFFNSTSILSMN